MLDAGRVRAEKAINTEPIELKCLRVLGFIVTSECIDDFCPFARFVAVAFGRVGEVAICCYRSYKLGISS